MDIRHCAERICEHRFGAAKIGECSQKEKDVPEEILSSIPAVIKLING